MKLFFLVLKILLTICILDSHSLPVMGRSLFLTDPEQTKDTQRYFIEKKPKKILPSQKKSAGLTKDEFLMLDLDKNPTENAFPEESIQKKDNSFQKQPEKTLIQETWTPFFQDKSALFFFFAGIQGYYPQKIQIDRMQFSPAVELKLVFPFNAELLGETGLGYAKTNFRVNDFSEIYTDYLSTFLGITYNLVESFSHRLSLSLFLNLRWVLLKAYYFSGTDNFYLYEMNLPAYFIKPSLKYTYKIKNPWLSHLNFTTILSLDYNFKEDYFSRNYISLQKEGFPDVVLNKTRLLEYQILFGIETCLVIF